METRNQTKRRERSVTKSAVVFEIKRLRLLGHGRVWARHLHVEQPHVLELGIEAKGLRRPSLLQDLPPEADEAASTTNARIKEMGKKAWDKS